MKRGTPVTTLNAGGLSRIDHKIRGFDVYLLTRPIGLYWTYREDQLRELDANELSRLVREEERLK